MREGCARTLPVSLLWKGVAFCGWCTMNKPASCLGLPWAVERMVRRGGELVTWREVSALATLHTARDEIAMRDEMAVACSPPYGSDLHPLVEVSRCRGCGDRWGMLFPSIGCPTCGTDWWSQGSVPCP